MKMKYVLTSLAAVAAIGMAGCGSNGSDAKAFNGTFNGTIVDSPIDGMKYTCGSLSTTTTHQGFFGPCAAGTTAKFYFGGTEMGSYEPNEAQKVVAIWDIVPESNGDHTSDTAVKMAMVLLALDTDLSDDVITLPDAATQKKVVEAIGDDFETMTPDRLADKIADAAAMYSFVTPVSVQKANDHIGKTVTKIKEEKIALPPKPSVTGAD